MFRSVKNWLTILILALVALAMLVAYIYVVPPLTNRLDQQKLVEQRGSAKLISETLSTFLNDRPTLEGTIGLLGQRLTARVVVYTRNLAPNYDTQGTDPVDIGDYPMIEQALTSARVAQGVVITPTGRYAATAVPLVAFGSVEFVVLVIAPLRDVDAAVAAVQRQLLFAAVLALGVSLLLGYLASYFIARRLKRIERSAEAIAGGDLTAAVPASVEDEIGQLAATFNIMAVRLRGAFAQVEYERDRVEVLLNDLSEGVIGLSEEGT